MRSFVLLLLCGTSEVFRLFTPGFGAQLSMSKMQSVHVVFGRQGADGRTEILLKVIFKCLCARAGEVAALPSVYLCGEC